MNRTWGFFLFVAVAVVHLVALFTETNELASITKVMLMPALLVGFLIGLPTLRSAVALWGTLAILFSGVGDVLLSAPGDAGFIGGLGGFLIAHLFYLVLFLRALKRRRIPRLTIALIVVWWVALVVLLAPHLGALLIAVTLYGVVLGSSTAASYATSPLVAVGGTLFLVSDTLLAFRLFWPDFELWQQHVLIMLAYIVGQGLIVVGAVLQVRRASSGTLRIA